MATLYTHAHLVVDDLHEYVDGAFAVADGYIVDIYPHSNKINNEYDEIIDLKGQLVFPEFFDLEEVGLFYRGNIDKDYPLIFVDYEYVDDKLLDYLKDHSPKILLGNCFLSLEELEKLPFKIDGVYHIFENMKDLGKDEGLIDYALKHQTLFTVFNLPERLLEICLKIFDSDKMAISGNIAQTFTSLKKMGVKNNELLKMSSLNAYRFLKEDRLNGSLNKGKKAKFRVM